MFESEFESDESCFEGETTSLLDLESYCDIGVFSLSLRDRFFSTRESREYKKPGRAAKTHDFVLCPPVSPACGVTSEPITILARRQTRKA